MTETNAPTPPASKVERTLAKDWRDFYDSILKPINAPILQQVEMRRAFYAGAAAMFGLMMQVSADSVSEDEGERLLERLSAELDAFAEDLKARRV
jgi:hypothetical protein